ncbi:MAG: PAS domain-containing protein [Bacteroidales bacterium]|nr:PAS domain-containing protein [Bacteroidales bacterium]MBN2817800.1 PAS domain-containing protein [Bacteroidales bacterium]
MPPQTKQIDKTDLLNNFQIENIIEAASTAQVLINTSGEILCHNNEFDCIFPEIHTSDNLYNFLKSTENKRVKHLLSANVPNFNLNIQIQEEKKIIIYFKQIKSAEPSIYLGSAKLERTISKSELVQNLIDQIPDNIFIKDLDSKFLLANNWIARIMGQNSPKDLIGKSDADFYPEKLAQKFRKDEISIIQSGEPLLNYKEKVVVDDEVRWYSTTKLPLFDSNGHITGIMGIGRDITTSVREQKALQKAKKEAEKADMLKSTFLANLSHEIRTPLNGILGFSQFLRQKQRDPEKQQKYLDIIMANGKNLLLLINDIIDISMIDSNQIAIKKNTFSLNKMLDQLKATFSQQISNKGLDIKIEIFKGLPDSDAEIYTDEVRLNQIISNLVTNAIKFTHEGKIDFGYSLEKEDTLHFYVRDTGIGIPEEYKAQIFERFRQVDESMTRTYGGTGLGLSICTGLVKKLGGNIWVNSKINKGSVFHFTVPYEKKTEN